MFKKNNAVIAVVVLFLCVAVYLNWSFNRNGIDDFEEVSDTEINRVFGDSVLVTGEPENTSPENADPDKAAPKDNLSAGSIKVGNDYFADVKLRRQQARDNALSILKDASLIENTDKEKTTQSMTIIAADTVREAKIETLVKAKGFAECVALISEESISVVVAVPADGLLPSDVAKIKDIVISETGVGADMIKIVEVKI